MRLLLIIFCTLAALVVPPYGNGSAAIQDRTERILSSLPVPTSTSYLLIALSDDRRTLFVLSYETYSAQASGATQAVLSIYDVSRPDAPAAVATLKLGDINFGALGARAGRLVIRHGWPDRTRPFGFMIIDVHDPRKPTIAGNIAINGTLLDLSTDGKFVRLLDQDRHELVFKIDPPDKPQQTLELPDRFEPAGPWRGPLEVAGVDGFVRDRLGSQLLAEDPNGLYLWAREDGIAHRETSIVLDKPVRDARFLSETEAIVQLASGYGTAPYTLVIVAIGPRPFDKERLERVHAGLLIEYPAQRKQLDLQNPSNAPRLYRRLATAMEDAGVRALLDSNAPPAAARTAILNDYGFWLSRTEDPRVAIPVLQRVIAQAPRRALAYLNLADAARASIAVAATWDEKTALAKIGLEAYASYKKLSGKEGPAARDFEALHRATSADVCSYVADFYNRGREMEMWGLSNPIDIAGDGKLRHVYIFHGGTAYAPGIVASTEKLAPDDYNAMIIASEAAEINFSPSERDDEMWLAEPHVMPFMKRHYVVYESDDGPVAVVKPNAGTVCRFKRSFTPVTTEDRARGICRLARAGVKFVEVARQVRPQGPLKLSSDRLGLVHTDSQWVWFESYSDAAIGGGSVRLGHFEIASGAGRGCDVNGVALLKNDELEESPLARALIDAQRKMMNCRGSRAYLVSINGETLVEIDGGGALQRTVPPRLLLRLRDNSVESVCRIEQKPTYTPQSSRKP